MKKLICSEILQKSYFDSYSEFYLAMGIARECLRRGMQLDMSTMRIERDALPKNEMEYFRYLVSVGAICIDGLDSGSSIVEPDLYLNTDCFDSMSKVLFKELEDRYYWSFEYANEFYDKYDKERVLLNPSKSGNVLIHLVAYLLVGFYVGDIPKKKIEIDINGQKARSTYIYVNLVSCCKTLDWLEDILILNVDLDGYSVDIGYSIFCNNSYSTGKHKKWGVGDKKKYMEELGICEGSIAILWQRKGMCVSNPIGKIVNATVVKINEIGDDFIAVSFIAVNKTKEEVRLDYEDIPEDRRYMFTDILYSKPSVTEHILSLYELGIEGYFFDESELLVKIDKKNKVTKKVTIDGKVGDVEMREVDAIYWLLCQYEIDFDRNLYKKMYNQSEDLLWEMYGDY